MFSGEAPVGLMTLSSISVLILDDGIQLSVQLLLNLASVNCYLVRLFLQFTSFKKIMFFIKNSFI